MALLNNGRPANLASYLLAELPTTRTALQALGSDVGSLVYVRNASSGVGAVAFSRFVYAGSPPGAGVGSPADQVEWIDLVTNIAVA